MIKQIYLENACTFQTWIVSFVAVLLIFVALISSRRIRRHLDFSTSGLLIVSVVIWCFGLLLYCLGFYRSYLSFSSVVPNAILSSFKMFLVYTDVSRVSPELANDNTYMVLFTLCHFCAAMVSFLWLTKLIGFRIRHYFRFMWCSLRKHDNDIVNIFWGVNDASLIMADSICSHKDGSGKRNVVVFVDTKDTSSADTQKNVSLANLFDIMRLSRFEQRKIEDIQAYVTACHYDLSDFHDDDRDLLKYIRQDGLKRMIETAFYTRIFILSEKEESNMFSALNILQDPILSEKNNLTVYAQASLEATCDIKNLKIIDLAYLAVAQLKIDGECHPVNNVLIDAASSTVASEFNSMIIGYGNTGKEAFRFLYEFASFVNSKGEKTPFTCHVVDKSIDKVAGTIRMSMPAIGEDEMRLVKAEIGSMDYWNLIQAVIPTMNYIVIALPDDDLSMVTAIDLYKTALRLRENDLKGLDIYVRCSRPRNYYKMMAFADEINGANRESSGRIVVFGDLSSIYTYDLIIEDDLLKQAKEFHKAYEESRGVVCESADIAWERSFGEDMYSKIMNDNPGSTQMNVGEDITRRIMQNFSNSLHKSTKYKLLGLDADNLHDFRAAQKLDVKLRLENLAKCEHIRWESSHKLMGYTYNPKKSIILKHHDCLTSWDNLDDMTRSYDYNVVTTSINLYTEE